AAAGGRAIVDRGLVRSDLVERRRPGSRPAALRARQPECADYGCRYLVAGAGLNGSADAGRDRTVRRSAPADTGVRPATRDWLSSLRPAARAKPTPLTRIRAESPTPSTPRPCASHCRCCFP